MKKYRILTVSAALIIGGIIFHSCQKEENLASVTDLNETHLKHEASEPDCSINCLSDDNYFELSDSRSITVGKNTKTVGYTAYNTPDRFFVKVAFDITGPSNAKAEISIGINGDYAIFEDVSKGSIVSHYIALPEDWEGCDEVYFVIHQFGLGQPVSFENNYGLVPLCPEGVVDADGNQYSTITIENGGVKLEWMSENLKTTKYSDGTPIEYPGSDNEAWSTNTAGAYAWFSNDESRINTYGALYNWYAVNNEKGLCPAGWRVPTDAEWTELVNFAGGASVAGGKLKSIRTEPDDHPRWAQPNSGATDEFGFSALPGGNRVQSGAYLAGLQGRWWSSTEINDAASLMRSMRHNSEDVSRGTLLKSLGLSVRCVREIQ